MDLVPLRCLNLDSSQRGKHLWPRDASFPRRRKRDSGAGLCWLVSPGMALGSPGSGSGLAVEKEESLTKHCSQLTGLWSVSMRPWPLSKLVGPGGG